MATKKNTGTKPVGRPSKYSDELAELICARIANGESLRSICRDDGMPSKITIQNWLNSNDSFLTQYVRARDERAEVHFEEMLEIADSVIADASEVAKARVQIDTRKWILSRMNPKKYGDKITQEHTGKIDGDVSVIKRVIVDPKNGNADD